MGVELVGMMMPRWDKRVTMLDSEIGGILRCRGPRSKRRILSGGYIASRAVKEMYICMKLVCTFNMFDQARRMSCV